VPFNKFVYAALEGRNAVGNTNRQAFVLKKLTISFKGGVAPFLSLQGHLVIRQSKVNRAEVLVSRYSKSSMLGSGYASSKVKRLIVIE